MYAQYEISHEQLRTSVNRAVADLVQSNLLPESTGWIDYPTKCSEDLVLVKEVANKIQSHSDTLVVVGTGGSYLGAAAMIEALGNKSKTKVIFVGYSLSSAKIAELLEYVARRNFSLNIISKSGSTLETSVVAEIFINMLKDQYFSDYAERVVITTEQGSKMDELAQVKGYQTLYIPKNIGGRYSVTTPVGLLPMAVAGLDIDAFVEGEASIRNDLTTANSAACQNIQKYIEHKTIAQGLGKTIELIVVNDERLVKFGDWLQQLIAESLGKSKLGSYPSTVLFSRDLHSVGQYIQDGTPNVAETVIHVVDPGIDISMNYPREPEIFKGLEGCESLNRINQSIAESALEAHFRSGVPIYVTSINQLNEHDLGVLVYLFEMSVACLGILMGINPFDQPAVEDYKRIMKAKYPER